MTTESEVGTQESYKDAVKNTGVVGMWLDAISLASKEENDWRKQAQNATDLYRQQTTHDSIVTGDVKKKFNILHSNIETIVPALYNSVPSPDVRPRYSEPNPLYKSVADIIERCLSYSLDSYDFDHTMKLTVKDSELAGRAVARVRYKPYLDEAGQLAYQEALCEHVPWKHFRRGPANEWAEVGWIAFELFLTREELTKLSPKLGGKVTLDVQIDHAGEKKSDGRNVPEIFKRARVWEIWDKDHRKVLFIAESYKDKPIREEDDPLRLVDFYPIPRPIYSIDTSDSLVPVVPYEIYRAQAEELERVSQRIMVLTEAVKARAVYDSRMSEMSRLETADDGENIPLDNPAIFADGSKLTDHIWYYPVEVIVGTLKELQETRDRIKQTIYEITGIADILRGQSNPNETLGAQQIKQQWGSLRIQQKQQEIQRFARDLMRLKAEIYAEFVEPETLQMITGIPLTPEVMMLLRSDKMRGYKVDIETDSTIRADLTRNQQNMTQFLQGTAQFAQAMGPIVMTFKELTPAVMEVYSAFARNFKLGKQAEDALGQVQQQAQMLAQQPEKPNPELELKKQEMAMEQQNRQQEMQFKAAESQQKLGFEAQKHEQDMQFEREKHANDMQLKQQELQMKGVEHAQNIEMQRESNHLQAQNDAQKNANDFQAKREQTEASSRPMLQLDANEAVKGIAPAIEQSIQSNNEAIAQAAQAMTQAAMALTQVAHVMAADNEIVRDAKGRATGSRKVLRPTMVQ